MKKTFLITFTMLFCIISMFPQNIDTYKLCMNCELDTADFKEVYTYKATVEMSSPTMSNYLNVPQMHTCWLIKTWGEYSSVVKKTNLNPSVFNKYNLLVYVAATGGGELPAAEIKIYGRGNERYITSYVMPMSLLRNMLYVIVSALIPKEHCFNISCIYDFDKRNVELIKKVTEHNN